MSDSHAMRGLLAQYPSIQVNECFRRGRCSHPFTSRDGVVSDSYAPRGLLAHPHYIKLNECFRRQECPHPFISLDIVQHTDRAGLGEKLRKLVEEVLVVAEQHSHLLVDLGVNNSQKNLVSNHKQGTLSCLGDMARTVQDH